jgi:hypothetical protein
MADRYSTPWWQRPGPILWVIIMLALIFGWVLYRFAN